MVANQAFLPSLFHLTCHSCCYMAGTCWHSRVCCYTEALMGTATVCLSPALRVEGVIMVLCGKSQASGTGVGTLPAGWVGVCSWGFVVEGVGGAGRVSALSNSSTQEGESHMRTSTRVSCYGKKCCLYKWTFLLLLLLSGSVPLLSFCLEGRPLYLVNIDSASCLSSQPLYSTQPIPPCPLPNPSQHAAFIMVICPCLCLGRNTIDQTIQNNYLRRGAGGWI